MPMSTPSPSAVLAAEWFDGRSTRARPVRLRLVPGRSGPGLELKALDAEREHLVLKHHQVGWPERWSARRAPPVLVLDLGEHGSVQLSDVTGWQAALEMAGKRESLAERMQTRWPVLLAVLLVAVIGLWGFYRHGTPWAATQLARAVPLQWEQSLADTAMAQIDARYLKPSKLPKERQAELQAGFDRLAAAVQADAALKPYGAYAPPLKLLFRSGLGANAFALPGGTVVLTDGIVEQARSAAGAQADQALLGVMAHEIGHVLHRHGTRMVVEQGVLNIGMGLALGDMSVLVSTGASVITGLAYSRQHENEADCYAARLMQAVNLPAEPMGRLLLAITREMEGRQEDEPAAAGGLDWLSTHPDTVQRAERLSQGVGAVCGA